MRLTKQIIVFIMDTMETVVFVGSVFIVFYLFIMQPNQVKGASMEPTFSSGDYILTSKITYKFRSFERGDVVVFRSPKNPDIEYIKRIIALPGDVVTIQNKEVYVNSIQVKETYIADKTNVWDEGYIKEGVPILVPQGFVFVMGDNRTHSSDSREFGPILVKSIIGHVFYRYYPVNKTGVVKNPLPPMLQRSLTSPQNSSSFLYPSYQLS